MDNYIEMKLISTSGYGKFHLGDIVVKYKYLPALLLNKNLIMKFKIIDNVDITQKNNVKMSLLTTITDTYGKFYLKDTNNNHIRFDFKYLPKDYLNKTILITLEELDGV